MFCCLSSYHWMILKSSVCWLFTSELSQLRFDHVFLTCQRHLQIGHLKMHIFFIINGERYFWKVAKQMNCKIILKTAHIVNIKAKRWSVVVCHLKRKLIKVEVCWVLREKKSYENCWSLHNYPDFWEGAQIKTLEGDI